MADTFTSIVGNLTDEPERKVTPQGHAVANLRLAVTPRVQDGDSWKDGETSFFRVNVWRDQAEHVAESLARAPGRSSPAGCGPLVGGPRG
jgi:single-strand DNA-binding protein